jgi:hypothetical protein
MQHQIEPHALTARIRGTLLFLLAWPTLVVAMRRRSRPTERWVGDSHDMTPNRKIPTACSCVRRAVSSYSGPKRR